MFLLIIAMLFSCSSNSEKALELYIKGKKAYNKKDLNNAEKLFYESIKNDSSLHNAKLMLSKIYYYHKKYSEALHFLNSILKDNDNHIGALYWKARILLIDKKKNINNEKIAVECLQKVLEHDIHHIRARTLLALLYEKMKMYKEAIYEYRMLLNEEEALINGRANLAILYKRMGLGDKSLNEMNKAIKIADISGVRSSNLKFLKKEVGK